MRFNVVIPEGCSRNAVEVVSGIGDSRDAAEPENDGIRASRIYAMFEVRARWINNGTVRWPHSNGEMAGRVREHDWAATPLGPIEGWPQCLKTFVDMLLSNGFAMAVLWGRDLIQIYNDAHRDLIADIHPALGRPTREAWAEYWTQTAPVIDRVWAGETLTFFDVPQAVTRRGATEEAWFTTSYSPLRDETGAVAGVLVTLLETTEQMRTQIALRDSESRLRLALEVAELGAWSWDPRDGRGHLDDRAAQIVGLPRGGAVDVAAAQRQSVHPDDLAPLQAAAAEGARTGEPFTLGYRIGSRDGSVRHVVTRGRGLLDAQGNVVRVVGTNRDVTVEREAELRLRASEARFRALVQSIRDYAIVGLDADGRITEWTDGAAKVIGYSGKSAIGNPVSMLYPPDDVRRGAPEQVLAGARKQGRVAVDGWRVRKDGTPFWANAIVTAIGDESGAIVGYTEVIRDLSEQKEMLEQREHLLAEATSARAEAERANQAKDEFLITLSHELRTPLAPILLWARALLDGSVPAEDVDHAIEAIVLSAESQLQLIEDLRDLSRLKSGRVQLDRHSNSVEEVARAAVEVIMPSAQAKGVLVELEVMPDLGNAVFDRGRFQQVLWNLLSNAVKFTPDGGRVSLHVRRHDDQLEAWSPIRAPGSRRRFSPTCSSASGRPSPTRPSSTDTAGWASVWPCAATSSSSTAARSRGPARVPATAPCSGSRFPG